MFGDHEKWLGVAVAERLDQFVPRGTHEQGRARLQGATARSKGSGGSLFEPRTDTQVGTPATDITLFQDGDEHDYNLGQRVGGNVLAQTMGYINGTISG